MGRDSYRGGSTLLKIWPTARSKPKADGLLTREVSFERYGTEPATPLLPPKTSSKKRKPKTVQPNSAPTPASLTSQRLNARPVDRSVTRANETTKREYAAEEVMSYLMDRHPACPKIVRKRIVKIATQGRWTGLTLAQAVFRSADHYVLTEVCGVHKLIECGIDHVAANRLAEPQRRTVLSLWGF